MNFHPTCQVNPAPNERFPSEPTLLLLHFPTPPLPSSRRAERLCLSDSSSPPPRLCRRLLDQYTSCYFLPTPNRPHLPMFTISRTTPAYYLTSVTHDRLPIFRTNELKRSRPMLLTKPGGRPDFSFLLMSSCSITSISSPTAQKR